MNITESQALMRFVDFITDPPEDEELREVAATEAVEALVYLIGRAGDALQVTTSPVPFLRKVANATPYGWVLSLRNAAAYHPVNPRQEVPG